MGFKIDNELLVNRTLQMMDKRAYKYFSLFGGGNAEHEIN